MTMSDRICLMNGGHIAQLGTPAQMYFQPRSLFVADFLGESNLLAGTVAAVDGSAVRVALEEGPAQVEATCHGSVPTVGRKVHVMVRPQNLSVSAAPPRPGQLAGRLQDSMITGSLTKLYLQGTQTTPIVAAFPTCSGAEQFSVGQQLSLHWRPADAVVIAE